MTSSLQSGQTNGACSFDAKYAVTISPVSFLLAQSIGIQIQPYFNMILAYASTLCTASLDKKLLLCKDGGWSGISKSKITALDGFGQFPHLR